MTNFAPPYIMMVPKIVKYYINVNTTNMIDNYIKDLNYFITPNSFFLNSIRIGPFTSSKNLDVRVQDFLNTNFKEKVQDTRRIEKVIAQLNEELFYFVVVQLFLKIWGIQHKISIQIWHKSLSFWFLHQILLLVQSVVHSSRPSKAFYRWYTYGIPY